MRCYACDIFKEIFICVPQAMQPLIPQLIARFVQVPERTCETKPPTL
jgi:hypothetical protein